MNKYKKLAKNSAIFAAANFGSKVMRFLIVPFYTYCMTSSEYGTVDTLVTTINLVIPVLMLAIHEAALRYALDKDINSDEVITNCFLVLLITSVCFLPAYFIFAKIKIFTGLWWLFYLLLISDSINQILMNFSRGIGKSGTFAIGGLLNTVILLASNVLLLAVFHLGIPGYLISMLLGFWASNIYIGISIRLHKQLSLSNVNTALIKKMLMFSFPLIPTAVMWWVMNASDRYVITWFVGVSATGIYAVSSKIPTIITVVYQIFQQAWQISAVEEKDSDEKEVFYTSVYNGFVKMCFLAAAFLILIIKPLIELVISTQYHDAWIYTPFLIISAVFSSLGGFLGVNYVVEEKTTGAFITALIGAALNLGFDLFLTPIIGVQGAALATLIGYYVLWLIRSWHTRRFIKIKQDYVGIHVHFILLIIQTIVLLSQIKGQYIFQIFIVLIMIIINYKDEKRLLATVLDVIRRRRKK